MKIIDFNQQFPDELSCRNHLGEKRENEGLICKRCNGQKHYWLSSIFQWKCTSCGFRTTLRSGTLMHDSKLPIRVWYLCMAFMSMSKKPMSAHEMRRQLGLKRYEPVWAMMRKIRHAMGQRDHRYGLSDMVELDEGFFPQALNNKMKLKRGKGSQKMRNVAVMSESIPLEDLQTGKTSSQCRFFKMKVLDTQKADSINKIIHESLDQKTIVMSDKGKNYIDIADYIEGHVTVISGKHATNNNLRWVHTAISNAKRTRLGIFHFVKGCNLQLYLDEFCYKLNRRNFGSMLFDRLTVAIASSRCIQTD